MLQHKRSVRPIQPQPISSHALSSHASWCSLQSAELSHLRAQHAVRASVEVLREQLAHEQRRCESLQQQAQAAGEAGARLAMAQQEVERWRQAGRAVVQFAARGAEEGGGSGEEAEGGEGEAEANPEAVMLAVGQLRR